LFVCDGTAGLKVYDATDKQAITSHQLAAFPDIKTYDVIPVNGYLFMVALNHDMSVSSIIDPLKKIENLLANRK
jgi:hypothetical protein